MSYKIRSVIKNKRGGMDVSVNSIIILIFAVIILSLGIAFIKKMFGSASNSLFKLTADQQKEMQEKLLNTPGKIVMDSDSYAGSDGQGIPPGKEGEALVAIRNYLDKGETFVLKGGSKCTNITESGEVIPLCEKDGKKTYGSVIDCYSYLSSDGTTKWVYGGKSGIQFNTWPSMYIDAGKSSDPFKIIIKPSYQALGGLYSCKIVIVNPEDPTKIYAQKKFTVEVKG